MPNELYENRREQRFPKLTPMQISRLETHGRRLRTQAGQVLVEQGQRHHEMVIVLAGSVEIGLPGMPGEELVTVLQPCDFAGEMSTLRGILGFIRIRVRDAGEILSINEESLRNIAQTDAEVSYF